MTRFQSRHGSKPPLTSGAASDSTLSARKEIFIQVPQLLTDERLLTVRLRGGSTLLRRRNCSVFKKITTLAFQHIILPPKPKKKPVGSLLLTVTTGDPL